MPERTDVFQTQLAKDVFATKYSMDGRETWQDTARRVAENVMGALGYVAGSPETLEACHIIATRKFIPGGRYLYASGRSLHQVQNCLLMRAEDSREGWAQLYHNSAMALMTGAGIGIDYSDVRAAGAPILRTGGNATGPVPLMQGINEAGRVFIQGGHRRSAIWAGLSWRHPDVFDFIKCKDLPPEIRAYKAKHPEFPVPMELTNISVQLDDEFFAAVIDDTHYGHEWAVDVYECTLERMLKTAEPGFSIDVDRNSGETLRNACTEITSTDDSDICNLGSINMARVHTIDEFERVVRVATLFLLAGTVYSDVPYEKVDEIRTKNRRLGLGLMGIHEWLLQRDLEYGPAEELDHWMRVYAGASREAATTFARAHKLSVPLKIRAIAPTGSIAIIGETTSGIEPIFATAFERRWLNGSWNTDTVIDPTAARLVADGHNPDTIEDAYTIPVERRVAFQAWMQQFVDHGISSTINLPRPIIDRDERDSVAKMLLPYLKQLRGLTFYPDGARGHQPLKRISYAEAVSAGAVVMGNEEACVGGACGA